MPAIGQVAPVAPVSLTVQHLAHLLAASKKDHLLEWKLSQFNGDPRFKRMSGFASLKLP